MHEQARLAMALVLLGILSVVSSVAWVLLWRGPRSRAPGDSDRAAVRLIIRAAIAGAVLVTIGVVLASSW
jgi:hypothetical protein